MNKDIVVHLHVVFPAAMYNRHPYFTGRGDKYTMTNAIYDDKLTPVPVRHETAPGSRKPSKAVARKCQACGDYLPAIRFSKNGNASGAPRNICKKCDNKRRAGRRLKQS